MLPKDALVSHYLAQEANGLLGGASLTKVVYYRNDKLFCFLIQGQKRWHIVFSFAPPRFAILKGLPKEEDSFEIWTDAAGSQIVSVSGARTDRVCEIALRKSSETGEHRDLKIIFELFGSLCNAYLVDSDGTILNAARVVADERKLRPRRRYLSPTKKAEIARVTAAVVGRLGSTEYRIIEKNSAVCIDPPAKGVVESEYPVIQLYETLYKSQTARRKFDDLKRLALSETRRMLAVFERQISDTETQLRKCAEADKLSHWADLLMANPNAKIIADKVEVADFYTEAKVEIPIPPGQSLIEASAGYYRRARKLKRSRAPLQRILVRAEQKLEEIRQLQTLVAKAETSDQLNSILDSAGLDVRSGKTERSAGQIETSAYFRVFQASTGEKILVGKSAEGNDFLTFRAARPHDLWLHAQQARGSHVILVRKDKNHPPPKRAIEEAAAAAAYFSDQKRSQNVPVIYAERRYVRKVRKGAPGQVIPQQVKSLFVDPALPPTSDES